MKTMFILYFIYATSFSPVKVSFVSNYESEDACITAGDKVVEVITNYQLPDMHFAYICVPEAK